MSRRKANGLRKSNQRKASCLPTHLIPMKSWYVTISRRCLAVLYSCTSFSVKVGWTVTRTICTTFLFTPTKKITSLMAYWSRCFLICWIPNQNCVPPLQEISPAARIYHILTADFLKKMMLIRRDVSFPHHILKGYSAFSIAIISLSTKTTPRTRKSASTRKCLVASSRTFLKTIRTKEHSTLRRK